MAIEIKINPGEKTEIAISGNIDESAGMELDRIQSQSGKNCVVDLSGIEQVSSLGVKAWIEFIRGFSKGRTVVLEKCSPTFVAQINMIPVMSQGCELRSLFVPYRCGWCDFQETPLIDLQTDDVDPEKLTPKCGNCGNNTGLDDDCYFDFLKEA